MKPMVFLSPLVDKLSLRITRMNWNTWVIMIITGIATIWLFSADPPVRTANPPGQNLADDQLFTQWAAHYANYDPYTQTPIRLGYIKGLSRRFTKALGRAEINFKTGEVTVNLNGLASLPEGQEYQVWLVDHIPGEHNSVALDLGKGGDRIINLGSLPTTGPTVFSVSPEELAQFEVDMAAVMRTALNRAPEFVVGGLQSIFFKINRQARVTRERNGFALVATAEAAKPSGKTDGFIKKGREIFFNETFKGNGRTCGTCHREENSFIINPTFIQELTAQELAKDKPEDPLFVAGIFDPGTQTVNFPNPNLPPGLFEDPPRMFSSGLILENQDGFDDVCGFPGTVDGEAGCIAVENINDICNAEKCEYEDSKSNRRDPPTVINMQITGTFGLGGDIPDLQAFDIGAVVQHFPITLNRIAGEDFRLPKKHELEAMEAFQNSLLLPKDVADPGFDPFHFVLPGAQQRGAAAFRAGVFEQAAGSAGKCIACHGAPFVDGAPVDHSIRVTLDNSVNFDTGVNALAFSQALPFDDGGEAADGAVCGSDFTLGPGSCAGGSFDTRPLIGVKNTAPFFHNGASPTLRDAVLFYASLEFLQSTGGQFIQALTGSPIVLGNSVDDIVAFLEALGQTPSEATTALTIHIQDDVSFKGQGLEPLLTELLDETKELLDAGQSDEATLQLEAFQGLVDGSRNDFVSEASADGLIAGADLIIEEIEKG